MQLSEGKLKHLKALSNKDGIIAAAAMDQRGSLRKSIASAKGVRTNRSPRNDVGVQSRRHASILTPHASAILLDPEFGLPAAQARAKNAGLLLAYEESGYDNTNPAACPICCPHVSVKRICDWGADAVKILIYYTPFDDAEVNDIKHAFIERIGAECEANEIPFFLEFVGYDPKGGDEKGLEYAKIKPEVVIGSMKEFAKPQYNVDVLKVEVPVNAEFRGRADRLQRRRGHIRGRGARTLPPSRRGREEAVHLSERRSEQRSVRRVAWHGCRSGHGLFRCPLRARHLERRHASLCQARRESARRLAVGRGRQEHQCGKQRDQVGQAMARKSRSCNSRGIETGCFQWLYPTQKPKQASALLARTSLPLRTQ